MRSRARLVLLALGLAAVLTAGCTADAGVARPPGDRVSSAEATALADLLHRNRQEGGEIDFRHSVGRAQAVTTFTDGRPDDTRTVFFSPKDLWIGDVRGLTTALTRVGLPKVAYLRRPLTAPDAAAGTPLMDVIVRMLVNLSAPSGDDARDFLATGYTWQGQRSIDSRLASLFRLHDGRTVAVATTGNLLLQYVTPLVDGSFDVTVTLSDHGPRAIDLPSAGETAAAADHQAIATVLGI
jgi:hypothetical protein